MEIYYININEFKNTHNKSILNNYADKNFNSEKRFFEYTIGRYLIKNVAQKIYKIDDTTIILSKDGKPVFKDSDLKFSLSHSKDYVIACFDKNNCGIDIEYIKERNFERLSRYYNRKFKTAHDFYNFWTLKEAAYKLGTETKDTYSAIFENNYYLSIASETIFDKNVVMRQVQ
ncbi:hypothetical protein J6N69_06670 [bacterium]|nr:hypothetical protein [bacterium]